MTIFPLITFFQFLALTSYALNYKEKFHNQAVDHFSIADMRRWQQRYLISTVHWNRTGSFSQSCKEPILLYTGNEGDITEFWQGNGFMTHVLAPKWRALLLFVEARYYGKSLPFGNRSFTKENIVFLSTEQILQDVVELLQEIKQSYRAMNCPVIAFGGSYGGTLTTFLRKTYPSIVDGGLASSAPIGYYDKQEWPNYGVTEYSWSDLVYESYANASPDCPWIVEKVLEILDSAPEEVLVKKFTLCNKKALGPSNRALFTYYLESIPQLNYPYRVGKLPAFPSSGYMQFFAQSLPNYLFKPENSCLPAMGGPGNIPGDGPGMDAWGYQSCTETLHEFSSRKLRTYKFNISEINSRCSELYGKIPDPSKLRNMFGGYSIAYSDNCVTNMIWSNGLLDPWSGGGFLKPPKDQRNHHILIRQGAHHYDLRGPHVSDTEEIKEIRRKEEAIIYKWIVEASKRRAKKDYNLGRIPMEVY